MCTIRKNAGRANLPFVLEPACPVGVSELKVSFTVRAVGMYIVRLSISGMPIGSSQFERSYLPGECMCTCIIAFATCVASVCCIHCDGCCVMHYRSSRCF